MKRVQAADKVRITGLTTVPDIKTSENSQVFTVRSVNDAGTAFEINLAPRS